MRITITGLLAWIFVAAAVGCNNSDSNTDMAGAGADMAGANNDMATGGPSCAPSAACTAADKSCIGVVDNSGKGKFGLRMSEVDIISPGVLTKGLVGSTVGGSFEPSFAACNLNGPGTASWLLQFDTTAGTIKLGGARPVADITAGYSFDDEMIGGIHVQPVVFNNAKPDASGKFAITAGTDVILPIFLDPTGNSVLLLPLKQARPVMGTLSANNNCIGSYNAAGLDPGSACTPDATHPLFISGGKIDGNVTLEDADAILIAALNQSLCVVLTGDATMYGMTMSGRTVCKRDANGQILFKGDWCSTTDRPSDPSCFDAVQFAANFAAGSVLINN